MKKDGVQLDKRCDRDTYNSHPNTEEDDRN